MYIEIIETIIAFNKLGRASKQRETSPVHASALQGDSVAVNTPSVETMSHPVYAQFQEGVTMSHIDCVEDIEHVDHDLLIDGSGLQYEIDHGVEDFAYAVLMVSPGDFVAK